MVPRAAANVSLNMNHRRGSKAKSHHRTWLERVDEMTEWAQCPLVVVFFHQLVESEEGPNLA